MMKQLILTQPDDCHLHLREGSYLSRTVQDASRQFARAIVMPNLQQAVTTVEQAMHYYQSIIHAVPHGCDFQPLLTLYLSQQTTVQTILQAKKCPHIFAVKLYPAGATTLSAQGVHSISQLYPIFEVMQSVDLPLLIHGEVPSIDVDIFDREKVFIERELIPLLTAFPKLRIVLEHISTKYAVEFVQQGPKNLAATITAHHLLFSRNDMLVAGIKPHLYCMPILKRDTDRKALVIAATSGNPKFFLGTDSAPHRQQDKESPCGCAGVYTAHIAMALYAHIFDEMDKLQLLQGFASQFGAEFYQLAPNKGELRLEKKAYDVPKTLDFGDEQLIPLYGGKQIPWSIVTDE